MDDQINQFIYSSMLRRLKILEFCIGIIIHTWWLVRINASVVLRNTRY